ncbi:momilactone A synthase-like [Canna indica]|uniref:Momilactone A synthase-like n=1 Tax=Canna indica TaxID=4628 RepID=A0AAQ3KD50_9LILI|nr:momilactone A synthase-like [Canna indica]
MNLIGLDEPFTTSEIFEIIKASKSFKSSGPDAITMEFYKKFWPLIALRLEGKVAFITGGASGIGECTAKLFARHHARVVVADIQDDKGRALCVALGPAVASYVHCDVTSKSDMERAVDAAVARYGKLDIMFSNAGIMGTTGKGVVDSEKPEIERVMAANVTGAFLAIKHAARVMAPARHGSIVITASNASVIAPTMAGITAHAYLCSKNAVVGLMRSTAAELGRYGIRVNCVSPHGVATPLGMGATGMNEEEMEALLERSANLKGVRLKAEDVAAAVAYLGGDEARYVSGVNLLVDGGFSITKSVV